jgi:hypothetical protein
MTFQFLFFFIPCGRLEIPIHRSWIDFGRNTMRGRSVRRRPCLFGVAYLLPAVDKTRLRACTYSSAT